MINWEKSASIPKLTGNDRLLIVYGTNQLADSMPFREIVTSDELVYADRLKGEGQKSTWLACRASLRLILSSSLNKNPQEIEFRKAKFGKPYLADSDLSFNVSHSKCAFLLGFNFEKRIGVDIELLDGSEDLPSLVKYAFSASEATYCDNGKSPEHFTEIWTLKEAFLKATGRGLVDDLPAISVIGNTNDIGRKKLFQESFRCPNGETGAVVYQGTQALKFIGLT